MKKRKKIIMVTGCAGFIGYHIALRLLKEKYSVVGIDNLNSYYSRKLKIDRIKDIKKYCLEKKREFIFIKLDLKNKNKLEKIFKKYKPSKIIHLAAQAGVRYSLINPEQYLESNIYGFFNILECCRKFKIKNLIFASSSSVYGNLNKKRFSEKDTTDFPIQFYAATKKSNEVMAHAYSSLYNINCIGLRFFTVYGPWGRPDMSIFKFTQNILRNKKIDIYNFGKHKRDFTFIDDLTSALFNLVKKKTNINSKKFQLFNIGNSKPQKLIYLIKCLEEILQKKAKRNYLGLQKGDVEKTFSNTILLKKFIKFNPKTNLQDGLNKFVSWYKKYYNV